LNFIRAAADSLLDGLAFYGPFGELFTQCLKPPSYLSSGSLPQKVFSTLKVLVVEAGDQTDHAEGFYPLLKNEHVSIGPCVFWGQALADTDR
jgi:hypothetical protein